VNDTERNLAWKLNWWRQSELEGSLLLGRMVSIVDSEELCARLTRHCAEEARHSQLWANALSELGLPHVRIRRSYQSFYLRHTGAPGSLLEVLAFTQIFERRVHRRFHEEVRDPKTPPEAVRAYLQMMEDEKNHLAWVANWLNGQSDAPRELKRFGAVDRLVFAELLPWQDRLWEIPHLGVEAGKEAAR
jgi:hypothetical protein